MRQGYVNIISQTYLNNPTKAVPNKTPQLKDCTNPNPSHPNCSHHFGSHQSNNKVNICTTTGMLHLLLNKRILSCSVQLCVVEW